MVIWADSVDSAEERANAYLEQIIDVFSQGVSEIDSKFSNRDVIVEEVPVGSGECSEKSIDIECNPQEPARRPVLIQALLTAATLTLVIAAMGSGWRQVAMEIAIDKKYLRLAFLIAVPFQIWLALVGCLLTITLLLMLTL